MRAEELLSGLDASRFATEEANSALWEAIPPEMRMLRFTEHSVPPRYRGGFAWRPDHPGGPDLAGLPTVLGRELAWCVFRIVDRGGVVVPSDMSVLVRRLGEVVADLGPTAPSSLVALPVRDWQHQIARAVHRRRGRLPAVATSRTINDSLNRCYRLLSLGYDTRPWWQREVWDPGLDQAIPQRPHEPYGRRTIYFRRIEHDWLRGGAQWYCRLGLETGALSWSTVIGRVDSFVVFDAFLTERGVTTPLLAEDPAGVRTLMLDFLGYVRAQRVVRAGPTFGRPLSGSRINSLLTAVEQLYGFLHEHRDTAALALGEPGWARLGAEHARLFRHGEKPRPDAGRNDPEIIDDGAFSQIMAGLELLAKPVTDDGLGDEQAMRILMLLARTGRRMNEILMLDRDPLLPLTAGPPSGNAEPDGFVARLRYQQTKISGAPDTIPVDAEIVAIIKAQQAWADRVLAERCRDGSAKYLFLAARMNGNGDRPYSPARLHDVLSQLVRRLDIRDGTGRLVDFQRTHRFRHTRATSLLNAGVPMHVVQRHLGHLSPAMTMRYAQTLATTHEREFLRFKKINADGRELEIDPRDLYDMLELDRRADRVLPNGWCLLPPRQVCAKGNACLSCDKFATDASYLPEHEQQLHRLNALVAERQQAFHARTGAPMGEDNIWLTGRRQEQRALHQIVLTLAETRNGEASTRAVRGAGTCARHPAADTDTAGAGDAQG
jgi:integrase